MLYCVPLRMIAPQLYCQLSPIPFLEDACGLAVVQALPLTHSSASSLAFRGGICGRAAGPSFGYMRALTAQDKIQSARKAPARLGPAWHRRFILAIQSDHGDTDFHKAFDLALGYLKHGM
jgi:hypothetical protein